MLRRERAWLAQAGGAATLGTRLDIGDNTQRRWSANPHQEGHATYRAATKRNLDTMRAGSIAEQAEWTPAHYYPPECGLPSPLPLPALAWMEPFAGGNAGLRASEPSHGNNLPAPPFGTKCALDDAT